MSSSLHYGLSFGGVIEAAKGRDINALEILKKIKNEEISVLSGLENVSDSYLRRLFFSNGLS